jgi:hypothetical protein
MRARLDHLIKRPAPYTTADETQQPGYLQRRFRALRQAARKPSQPAAVPAAPRDQASKVAPIHKRRAA